jgi:GntR family transcriptional regulator / MocR family aminotransferase
MSLHVSLVGRKDLSGEIYRQVRRAILDGRLRSGDRLTASRELARTLSVSRMTVTTAYERLAGEGFVVSRIGAGTFVGQGIARPRPEPASRQSGGALQPKAIWASIRLATAFDEPARFDFRTGLPDVTLFPHRTWRRLVAQALRSGYMTAGTYDRPAGNYELRAAIARHVGISRSVEASADGIMITNGAQQAVDLIARTLLASGDRIAMEDPGYQPARSLFAALGLRVVGVPVDRAGLVVDALPRGVRAVYVTPSHQYPLGVAMSLQRRQSLLAWAERTNAAVIEDDYDSEFRFSGRPLEPLQTLDATGRVLYVGSFSKTLLPTLRLGFLVAPPSLRSVLCKAKYAADWHTGTLMQTALARLIDEGGFARHIRRVNAVYKERHELISQVITRDFADHLELMPSTTGLHLTALARRASVEEINAACRRAVDSGVALQRLSAFAVSSPERAGIVLGYGAIPTRQIREGLRRLRKCFDA